MLHCEVLALVHVCSMLVGELQASRSIRVRRAFRHCPDATGACNTHANLQPASPGGSEGNADHTALQETLPQMASYEITARALV